VLLIDEIDRADEGFEAFLLEVLSYFQITIPELGTIKATRRPYVVITSNQTRELHDALKRRCLYHWIDYPSLEKELRIVLTKVPAGKISAAGMQSDAADSGDVVKPGTKHWIGLKLDTQTKSIIKKP
jgi:MoxR-like ATPase